LGPWQGGPEGELNRLRLPYRVLLNEQKFVVIHARVSERKLENATVHALPQQTPIARSALARARCRNMAG